MPPPESSEPGRRSAFTFATIPDLTNKIIRSGDQYCEAGGFGDVFRCRYKSVDGVKEVAVKVFRFSFTVDEHKGDGGRVVRMIRRELGIWKRLNHPNIVPFLGIAYGFGRQGSASLVSMWMPHGTLHSFLQAHDNQLAVAHRLQLLLDIANGLHYLHSFPMVHGDLSSNNVLLDHDYNACLTDFGCASLVGELPEGFAYLQMSTVRPGTLRWAAPEHFSLNEEETNHTVKSDIYSFGNMALLVLSGKYPWSEIRSDPAVVLRLSQGLKPGRPLARPIDDRPWALIERCWSSIPERPLAKDIVSSLEQHLDARPSPPHLRDLLDVPRPSFSAPNCRGDEDLNYVKSIESSLGRPHLPETKRSTRTATPLPPHRLAKPANAINIYPSFPVMALSPSLLSSFQTDFGNTPSPSNTDPPWRSVTPSTATALNLASPPPVHLSHEADTSDTSEFTPPPSSASSAPVSPPVREDLTRHADPSTSSPHHVRRPSSQALTIDTQLLESQKQQQSIADGFGEVNQVHRPLPEDASHRSEEPSLEHHLDTPIFDASLRNTIVARGLPTYLNEAQVYEFFQGFGKIKTLTLVQEDGNGHSKGAVFLEYANASVTDAVVQSLNGMELGDRRLVIQREGPSSAGADQIGGLPNERKARDTLKGNKLPQVENEDSAKQPGYSYSERRVLDAYQILLSVLDISISMQSSLDARHEVMQARVADLANNAFSCGVRSGDLQMAVELLEQGREILWNQSARFDISLTPLECRDEKGQDLVKKFKQLSENLRKHAEGTGEKGMDPYWRAHEKWESVVEEIRRQDGFSQFLLPPRFSYLQEAAECGPVIIVNGSKYTCDAVIVLHTRPPVHVPLECSLDDVVQLCSRFSELIQDPRAYGKNREFWVKNSLRELWTAVVEPIVTLLQSDVQLPIGSRIWWCPTSKFTVLPLHAAGPYRKHKRNLMGVYTSSYTPSLSALIRARRRARSQKEDRDACKIPNVISLVGVGQRQPSAALKLPNIPEVEREIEIIRSETSMPSDVTFDTVTGDEATIEGAVRAFRDHRWVHLACHGSQHAMKPFKSWFGMRDGPLTLMRIIQERYTHSELAFLSACDTAVGDESTPDEVLHLAAGMHFAGFNGVIGTLWRVNDLAAHEVVARFYRKMFKYQDINFRHAAAALNAAVVESAKEVPLEKLIVFVHIGI